MIKIFASVLCASVLAGWLDQSVAPKFVTWTEPKERSFSLDVPVGWQVEGGLNWLSSIDPQGYVRAKSPDGKLQVFFGDPELLGRQVPSAMTQMQTGAREGQTFRMPTGGPAMVQRYLSGTAYAQQHVGWRLCQKPEFVAEKDMPETATALARAVEPEARKYRLNAKVTAGEKSFMCGSAHGAVFAATLLVSSPSAPIQMWMVYRVAGFVSQDPLRTMEARYVMERMLASITQDKAWLAALERRTQELTGAVISMQNANLQASLAASRQQNETLSRMNRPMGDLPRSSSSAGGSSSGRKDGVNTTLGTKRVCDAINRCASVSNTSDNLYMDHSGAIRSGPASGGPPDNTGKWSRVYVQ